MSAYLGFAADLAKAEGEVLATAKEWSDDFAAAHGVVKKMDARVRDQLAAEYLVSRLREVHGDRYVKPLPQGTRTRSEAAKDGYSATRTLLDSLGVNARQVKVWAVSMGLLDAVVQGRVSLDLVQAYAIAHTPKDEPLPEELTA